MAGFDRIHLHDFSADEFARFCNIRRLALLFNLPDQLVFQLRHSEIQDEAKCVMRGVQIGSHLSRMHLNDAAARFQFQDDLVIDDNIEAVLPDQLRPVPDFDEFFALDAKSFALQLGD